MMSKEESVLLVIRASRPNFRNNHDKLAFAVHASFLTAGYVLISTGPPAFSDDSLSSSSSDEVGIDHWNEVDGEYAFVYKNPKKDNKKVLVKCLVMGDKLMVDALSDGASEPVHLDINVDDCTTEDAGSDYSAQYKNLAKLVRSLYSDLLSKLNRPSTDPSRLSGVREPNINLDESTSSQDPQTGFIIPPISPVGGSDLFPGPGAGMYPSRGGIGDGSMLVGPEDPRWFGGGGGIPDIRRGPGGLGIPPGARFDPYGPPGVPGFEPDGIHGRFPQGPNSGRGTRRPPGRIHPDLEQPGCGGFDYI